MIIIALSILLLTSSLVSEATIEKSHPAPKHKMIDYRISKTEFQTKGGSTLVETFTQTTPALCTFVNDIGFQGTSTSNDIGSNTAIFIQSDNVVIDLGGKTLYQDNTTPNMNGIEINSNQKNITIKNGSIIGFKGVGILARPGCSNIRIENVVISDCGKNGIGFLGRPTTNADIKNCIIQDSIVSRTTGIAPAANAVGLRLLYCRNVFIHNSLFGYSDGRAASMDGMGTFVQHSSNIVFDHCDASGNKGKNAYGFRITGSDGGSSGLLYECTAQDNNGSNPLGGIGYGFYTDNIHSFTWENCIAENNTGTKNGYGFYLSSTFYSKLIGCQANNNTGGNLATLATDGGRGFCTNKGIGNAFTRCTATGNQGNTTNSKTMGIGFDLQSENYTVINHCKAYENGMDTSAAWGIGINLTRCSQTIIKNSHFFNNRSSTVTQAYGIQDGSESSLITDCFLFGNGQGANYSNYTPNYPGQGETNGTTSTSAGGMGSITIVKPFQNVTNP